MERQTTRADAGRGGRLRGPIVALATALLLVVVAYGGGNVLAGVGVVALTAAGVEPSFRHLMVISVVSIQLVSFVGVSLAYAAYRGYSLEDLGVRRPDLEGWIVLGAGFVGTIVLWLVASVATFYVGARFGIERQQQDLIESGMQDPVVFGLLAVFSLLVVGPAEELLFRGIIQTRLRESFGVVSGLTLATALFASIHLPGFLDPGASTFELVGGALLGVSVLFVVGAVLAVAYEYTENLVVPAVIHGLFNATQAAFAYLSVRFGGEEVVGTTASLALAALV